NTFVLLIGNIGDGCTCFSEYEASLVKYCKSENALIYTTKPVEFDGGRELYGLKVSSASGYETMAIFVDGELKYQRQREGEHDEWSNNPTTFSTWMRQRIDYSDMLYINIDQFETLKAELPQFTIGWMRADCGDCSYVERNFLKTFNLQDRATSYVIDCDVPGIRLNEDGSVNQEKWQLFKDEHFLSTVNNEALGYGTGYVPTWQHVVSGQVDDMEVYFNDSVTKKEDGTFYVSQTYWDDSRNHEFFNYLSEGTTTNILNLEVPEEDIETYDYPGYGTFHMWKQEAAAKYHDKLLNDYLSFYLKK
ncbi:MAG: hypothetical protein K5694_05310, partial [Bacilli bacterium]|nr:hypothetical protein [Bacilli bacterium]